MPIDKLVDMEEKLRILEDLNMMYIRQIALSLQVKIRFLFRLMCPIYNIYTYRQLYMIFYGILP